MSEVPLYATGLGVRGWGLGWGDEGSLGGAARVVHPSRNLYATEREFLIDNLLVRIHFIIAMIKWTGLAPWEFEFPFPGSLTSTFLVVTRTPQV